MFNYLKTIFFGITIKTDILKNLKNPQEVIILLNRLGEALSSYCVEEFPLTFDFGVKIFKNFVTKLEGIKSDVTNFICYVNTPFYKHIDNDCPYDHSGELVNFRSKEELLTLTWGEVCTGESEATYVSGWGLHYPTISDSIGNSLRDCIFENWLYDLYKDHGKNEIEESFEAMFELQRLVEKFVDFNLTSVSMNVFEICE